MTPTNLAETVCLAVGLAAVVALIVHDLRSLTLPDRLVAVLGLAGIGYHGSTGWTHAAPPEALGGAAVGAALLYALRLAYLRLRAIEAIGLGDVKLIAAAGLWVGIWAIPALLAVAALGTLLTVLALRGLHLAGGTAGRAAGEAAGPAVSWRAQRVPFGPGLCIALVIVMVDRLLGT